MSKQERLAFVKAGLEAYDKLNERSKQQTSKADWIAFKLGCSEKMAAKDIAEVEAAAKKPTEMESFLKLDQIKPVEPVECDHEFGNEDPPKKTPSFLKACCNKCERSGRELGFKPWFVQCEDCQDRGIVYSINEPTNCHCGSPEIAVEEE